MEWVSNFHYFHIAQLWLDPCLRTTLMPYRSPETWLRSAPWYAIADLSRPCASTTPPIC
jgi:hypothetical protein